MNYQVRTDSIYRALLHRKKKTDNSNHWKPWTDEEKQFVRDNVTDKQSLISVANHLNRTVTAVEGMVYNKLKMKLAVPLEKQNKWLEATLIRMQELIRTCETTDSTYIRDKAKQELYTLSFKRNSWGGHKMPYKWL